MLPKGIEYGYELMISKYRVLESLFVLIHYRDADENYYTTVWDGLNWEFLEGYVKSEPKYRGKQLPILHSAVSLAADEKWGYNKPANGIFHRWMKKEGKYL